MPQCFQVLRCFKCAVFQVHQTKKSNKFCCKMCGEKQSIKRHYALGTGKECRLHVQKLNGIRGEIDETIENTSFEDEPEVSPISENDNECKAAVHYKNTKVNKSKWSNFVDKEEIEALNDRNESMYLDNAEVVLEVPKKRKKFTNPNRVNTESSIEGKNLEYSNSFEENHYERTTQESVHSKETLPFKTNNTLTDNLIDNSMRVKNIKPKQFIPPSIEKTSKWAQFTDDIDGNDNSNDSFHYEENDNNVENVIFDENDDKNLANEAKQPLSPVKNVPNTVGSTKVSKWQNYSENSQENAGNIENTSLNNKTIEKKASFESNNIFTTCGESELDDILNI